MGFCVQGTGKDVGKAVTELYRSFSRAAALVSTAEINVCSEELCSKLLSIEGDWTVKVQLLNAININYVQKFCVSEVKHCQCHHTAREYFVNRIKPIS